MTSSNQTKPQRLKAGQKIGTSGVWREQREAAEDFAKWLIQAYQWKPAYLKTKREEQAWLHGLFFGLAAKVSSAASDKRA